MTINEYFDTVVCISLARRPDRWAQCEAEAAKHNLTMQRFEAVDAGPDDGNRGCTESHGAVLRLIVEMDWKRTLILEDDFQFRFDDAQEQFGKMVGEVPSDAFMVYLGGHYAEKPIRRVSAHVIQMGHMKTTSSYGVTLAAATELAPFVHGASPIDEIYAGWHQTKPCYILTPRLIVQRGGYSDLQKAVMYNEGCMTDNFHENLV